MKAIPPHYTGTATAEPSKKRLFHQRSQYPRILPAIAEGLLAAKGYYRGNIDAIFGNGMEESVRSFQKSEGLAVDRIIGRETWSRIFQ